MRLPNFIIGGALKSGTTSLNYYLKQHPDVFMSVLKEPRYFAYDVNDPDHVDGRGLRFPIKTLNEYAALFAEAGNQRAIGEVSPHYLISSIAPRRIRETLPNVKLIFSLRHPVKRAYSIYWHDVRLGAESRPVEEALTEREYAVTHGLYHAWLSNWYDCFDPAQIKVILFDDLQRDAPGTFADICRYLTIQDTFLPDFKVRNKGGALKNEHLGHFYERIKTHPLRRVIDPLVPQRLRSRFIDARNRNFEEPPPMPPALAARLADFYREDIDRLEQLLGCDLSAWRNGH
jgi:hypothetical protein